MTIDFDRLARDIADRESSRTVTFRTERGSFSIPAELFEDERWSDLARHYAQRMPEGALPAGRFREKDGSVTVRWRKTHIVEL